MTLSLFNIFSSKIIITNSAKINSDFRFDAGFYEIKNSILITKSIEFVPLSTIASVVFPGIFKRLLVEGIDHGIKFLTTSEMMMIEPDSDKYLSIHLTSNLEIYKVSENTLLVSRSGSIGNTIYVDKRLKNFAITEDALRVKPFDDHNMGLLYFYFTSEFGNDFITGKKSGAVVDHIYEEDLLNLKVPIVEISVTKKLNDLYLKVKENREIAHSLVEKARILVFKYNNLPLLNVTKFETLDPNYETQISFTNLSEFTDDYRLDAHFYNPIAKKAIANIPSNAKKLTELTSAIFMCERFNRNYVEKKYGLPFLSGKNTIQIRPDVKYISITETSSINELKLKQGWLTITRSGTLGRVCYILKNYEDYAATEDLIRIIPNEQADSGYLYAFLSSEYGYQQILKYKHGAVIDHLTPEDMGKIVIPICKEQKEIGDLVRQAYDLRAEAIRLEDEAQEILTKALTTE